MKKILIAFSLILVLFLGGCKSQVETVDIPEPPEVPQENLIDKNTTEAEKPAESHAIEDPEEISRMISIVLPLLEDAYDCDLLYSGNVSVDETAEPETVDGQKKYHYVDSDYSSLGQIESLWKSTFVGDSKATDYYTKMIDDHLYLSINGELYIKEHGELPPMTMGEWNTDTIVIKEATEDTIVAQMETTLVGQPNGTKDLTVKNIDGNWLLTDSYFLD